MTEHTPAPWRMLNSKCGFDIVGDGKHIAGHRYVGEHETPEETANARLIAACPTMYAFIKRVAGEHVADEQLEALRLRDKIMGVHHEIA